MSDDIKPLLALQKRYQQTQWRHKKRGTFYEVAEVALMQASTAGADLDGAVMFVYRELNEEGERTGRVDTRPILEFLDGRFEHVQHVPDTSNWLILA